MSDTGAADLRTAEAIWPRIERMVRDVPGWSPLDQLHTLFCLAYVTAPLGGDILEIGSWCGRSSAVLGLAARLAGGTRVWCIDLFPERDDWKRNPDGSYSMEVRLGDRVFRGYQDQTVWAEPFERDIAPLYRQHHGTYEVFRQTIDGNGLADVVNPFRGTVHTFLADPAHRGRRFRLAFLDGDHGYAAVCEDIRAVDGMLLEGGWVCFDDAFSSYAGVDRAIREEVLQNPRYEAGLQMTRKLFVARKSRA